MINKMFAIDLRALAVFRIFVALILLCDYADRATSLLEHYTDWGSMPREALPYLQDYVWAYTFHGFSGHWLWVAFLFVLGIIFALMLLFGYYTRFANFFSWILLCSLHMRNFIILYSADTLLKALLFWMLFLPSGARFSLDRAACPDQKGVPSKILSVGSIAILLQVCFMYWFSVVYKWNVDWLEGHSVFYALHIDQFVTRWGVLLRQYPSLMKWLTYIVLTVELIGPIIALIPFRTAKVRICAVFTMISMHMAFGLMLHLGMFTYITTTAWILFLPEDYWDWVYQKVGTLKTPGISIFFNKYTSSFTPRPIGIKASLPANVLAAVVLCSVFIWNCYALKGGQAAQNIPAVPRGIVRFFHVQQQWNMFSRPLRYDGWFIVAGKLVSGQVVDLFKGGTPIDWNKPPMVSDTYYNSRWRKNMINLARVGFEKYRPYYCRWLCREWNSKHSGDEELEVVQLVYMMEVTRDDHTIEEPKQMLLYTHFCGK